MSLNCIKYLVLEDYNIVSILKNESIFVLIKILLFIAEAFEKNKLFSFYYNRDMFF